MAEADQCTCSGLRPEPGTNAIVGGGVPLAAGNAWAQRHDAEVHDDGGLASGMGVTVTYFGDGASNIGSTLETLNLAAAWRLPLCFYIENNLYAVSTHVADVTGGEPRLAARGPGFGIRSWRVDGMDPPLAVYLAQTLQWNTCAPARVQHSSS